MLWIALVIAGATGTGLLAQARWNAGATALSGVLLTVLLYGVAPPVVFFNLARVQITGQLALALGLALVALAGAGAIAYCVGRRVLHLDRPGQGALVVSTIQANTAYVGVPVAAAVLGASSVPQAILYETVVQAPAFLIGSFSVAAVFGTRRGTRGRWQPGVLLLANPLWWAAAAGLIAPDALAPDVLVDASRILVFTSLPIGFFAVGVTLGRESASGRWGFPPPVTATTVAATCLRNVVAPALLVLLTLPFVPLPLEFLILACSPVGVSTLMLAHTYGLDSSVLVSAVAWTTMVTLPVALVLAA